MCFYENRIGVEMVHICTDNNNMVMTHHFGEYL